MITVTRKQYKVAAFSSTNVKVTNWTEWEVRTDGVLEYASRFKHKAVRFAKKLERRIANDTKSG